MKRSAGILIIYNNKILLGHPTGSKWYDSYSIPKGGIEPDEDPISAAIRECEEEVGIKIKKSQLEKEVNQVEYQSKNKKKGIYKTVYYWICKIDNLSEIGLKDEVVPKNQLQIKEMDWAGFVEAKDALKRLAPSMKPLIKHLNMKLNEDLIPGGLADKHTPETIAKLHNVTVETIAQQIRKGVKVEMEHVDDPKMAEEIAMDHLVEMPDYYDKLEQIEPADAQNESKSFKMLDLTQFINEKYYTYDEMGWSEEEAKRDALIELKHQLPFPWEEAESHIKSMSDMSDKDKGIKFEVKLKSGDIVHMYKSGQYRGQWEFYLNKKKMKAENDLYFALFNRLSDLEKYLLTIKSHDFYHDYSDDFRAWSSGSRAQEDIVKYYSNLSNSDKKKAFKEYLKVAPKERKNVEFETFGGI